MKKCQELDWCITRGWGSPIKMTRVLVIPFRGQSRTQRPQAPWSVVWSPGETLGKWNFFPQKSVFPVVVRMLNFIKTEVNVNREVVMLDESLVAITLPAVLFILL